MEPAGANDLLSERLGVELDFRPRLQFHLAVLHLNRIFHSFTAILLADLCGLLLNEGSKTIEVAGHWLSAFFLGGGKRLIEFFHLVAFGGGIGALHRQRLLLCGCGCGSGCGAGMTESVHRVVLGFNSFHRANSLHGKQSILGTAVAFLANTALLAP